MIDKRKYLQHPPSALLQVDRDLRLNTIQTEPSETLIVRNSLKRKISLSVFAMTFHIQTLKHVISKFRNIANLKNLNETNQEQKFLLGDLGSSLDNNIQQNIDGKYLNKQFSLQDKKTILGKTYRLIKKFKQKPIQDLSEKFEQLLLTTIDPIHPFMYFWNTLNIIVIFYFLFSLLLEAAFQISYVQFECLYLREFIQTSLIILIMDSILRFNVKVLVRGELLENKKKITIHYFQNGFIYEILGLFGFVIRYYDKVYFTNECQIGESSHRIALQYLFIFKLHRLYQLIMFFDYKLAFNQRMKRTMKIFKLFLQLAMTIHLFACIWIVVGRFSEKLYQTSWMLRFEMEGDSPITIYFKSLYFACMTMTTVGYGDILPTNILEYILCILMMIISSPIFGYTLNTITNILQDIYNENEVYNNEVLTLARYMRKKNITQDLQDRVLDYLQCMQAAGLNDDHNAEIKILAKLSPSLREDLVLQEKGPIIQGSTAITEGFREIFLNKFFDLAQEIRFQPGEIVKPQTKGDHLVNNAYIYVIRGQLDFFYENPLDKNEMKHRVKLFSLKAGERSGLLNLFGEEQLNDYSIVSEDFTVLYILNHNDMRNLVYSKEFINSEDRIKYCQICDKVKLYKKYTGLYLKCQICQQLGHEFQQCSNFFYHRPKSVVLAKQQFSIDQQRRLIQRNRRHRNSYKVTSCSLNVKNIQRVETIQIHKNQIYQEQYEASNFGPETSNVRLVFQSNRLSYNEPMINFQDEDQDQEHQPFNSDEYQRNSPHKSLVQSVLKFREKGDIQMGSEQIQKVRVEENFKKMNELLKVQQEIKISQKTNSNQDGKFQTSDLSEYHSRIFESQVDKQNQIKHHSFQEALENIPLQFETMKIYTNYFICNNFNIIMKKYNMMSQVKQKFLNKMKSRHSKKKQSKKKKKQK